MIRYEWHDVPAGEKAVLESDAVKLAEALEGLLTRHNDGSEEEKWAEWDTAQAALADWRSK